MDLQFFIVADLFASQLKVKTLVHCTREEGGRVTIMVTNGNGFWLLLFTVDLQMGQMSFFGTLVLVLFL